MTKRTEIDLNKQEFSKFMDSLTNALAFKTEDATLTHLKKLPKVLNLDFNSLEYQQMKQFLNILENSMDSKDFKSFDLILQTQPNLKKLIKEKKLINNIISQLVILETISFSKGKNTLQSTLKKIEYLRELFPKETKSTEEFDFHNKKVVKNPQFSFISTAKSYLHLEFLTSLLNLGYRSTAVSELYLTRTSPAALKLLLKNKMGLIEAFNDGKSLNISVTPKQQGFYSKITLTPENIDEYGNFYPFIFQTKDLKQALTLIKTYQDFFNHENHNWMQWQINTIQKIIHFRLIDSGVSKEFIIQFINNHPEELNKKVFNHHNHAQPILLSDLIMKSEDPQLETLLKVHQQLQLRITPKPIMRF